MKLFYQQSAKQWKILTGPYTKSWSPSTHKWAYIPAYERFAMFG